MQCRGEEGPSLTAQNSRIMRWLETVQATVDPLRLSDTSFDSADGVLSSLFRSLAERQTVIAMHLFL